MNNYSTMLNSEILDGIEDIRQNQFIAEMNVMNAMFDYYQKESAFIEHCDFDTCDIDEVFTESASDSTSNTKSSSKGGKVLAFLKKIGQSIIDFFKMIAKGLKNLALKIKGLFSKNKKTMDQMCEEAGIPEAGDPEGSSVQEGFLDKFIHKESNTGKAQPAKEKFDDPGFNNITFRFVNRGAVEIEYKQVSPNKFDPGSGELPEFGWKYVTAIIDNNRTLELFDEFISAMKDFLDKYCTTTSIQKTKNRIKDAKEAEDRWYDTSGEEIEQAMRAHTTYMQLDHENKDELKEVNKASRKLRDIAAAVENIGNKSSVTSKTTITIDRLENISKRYYKFAEQFAEIFDAKYYDMTERKDARYGTHQYWAESINSMRTILNHCSMGISILTRQISNATIYVPKKYIGQAKNIVQIGKFVGLMLKNGTPPKYIKSAIIKVCPAGYTKDMKDGMSRLILFPTGDVNSDKVIKVAYNAFGLQANNNEFKFCKYLNTSKDPEIQKGKEYFAMTRKLVGKGVVTVMDRVKPATNHANMRETRKLIRTWLESTHDNNRNPFELEDLNSDGFGVTPDGRTVCIDYGWADIADGGAHLRLEELF